MLRILRFVVIGLLLSVPAFAAIPNTTRAGLSYRWDVAIDAGGHVTALQTVDDVRADVRGPLERAIRSWTFEAGRIDGQAAATETTLTIDISFLPAEGDRYSVRIDDARTGGAIVFPKGDKRAVPHMPTRGVRDGTAALVVVKVAYDADGQVLSVDPQASESVATTPAFDHSTVEAVRLWKVRPERVGGHGVPSVVMIPVCYTVGKANTTFDCTWRPHGSAAVVAQGGAFALDSAARLRSDVIGHAL